MGELLQRLGGPVPVNIYYSTDSGRDGEDRLYLRAESLRFRTRDAGRRQDGTLLGDPNNPVICPPRACRGLQSGRECVLRLHRRHRPRHGHECHWLRGTYDAKADRGTGRSSSRSTSDSRLQVRRHQLRRWKALLDRRRERPQASTTAASSAATRPTSPIPRSTRCCSIRGSNRAT